jgi:RNA polymerase sigma factor (sigma-70 family)
MSGAELPGSRRWASLVALRDDALTIVQQRVSKPEDAEDHLHNAMLRLADRDDLAIDDPARLRRLMVRVACHLAIDGTRRAITERRLLPRLAGAGRSESAEDMVADRSEARWLAEALPSLGAVERGALLHRADGRDLAEIAELLGVTYKAAANALSRARRKMRLRHTESDASWQHRSV